MKFNQLSPQAQERAIDDYGDDFGYNIVLNRTALRSMIMDYNDFYVFNEDGELEYIDCMPRLRM